jgi:hypothetical protein
MSKEDIELETYMGEMLKLQNEVDAQKLKRIREKWRKYHKHTDFNYSNLYWSFLKHFAQFILANNRDYGDVVRNKLLLKELVDMSNLIDMMYDMVI